jgi:hypothetical protein
MVEETKKITKKPKFIELEKKYTDEQIKEVEKQRFEKLKEIKAQHQPVSKEEIVNHARKYEDIIRQKREELRQKRGVLDSVSSNPNIIGNIPNTTNSQNTQLNQHQSSERIKNYKSKFYMD